MTVRSYHLLRKDGRFYYSFKQPLVCVAQSVGSTQHDKLNTRSLSCGGETDLETAKKFTNYSQKTAKKSKNGKNGSKKGQL